jgi:hypothetical protein
MCMFGGGNDAARVAAENRAAEEARQQAVREATGRVDQTFARFDDPFFRQREQAFTQYAMPQADDQYARARQQLVFALADNGLTRSSVAADQAADLDKQFGQRRVEIADQARGYGQQARAEVEGARSNLVNQAQATGDAALAGTGAVNEAARLSAAPTFSPLGALFQNVGAGIGTARSVREADAVRTALGGAQTFKPTPNSLRVVNN